MINAPQIPRPLMDYLLSTFPDKLPKTVVSPDQLGILVGQQEVINHLKAIFTRQMRSIPETT